MLLLADDYDRKALQAEEIEATLRIPRDERGPSLIPGIAEDFVNRLKKKARRRKRVSSIQR